MLADARNPLDRVVGNIRHREGLGPTEPQAFKGKTVFGSTACTSSVWYAELPNLVTVGILRAQAARRDWGHVALHVSEEARLARETAVCERRSRTVARVDKRTVCAEGTEVAAPLLVRQGAEPFPAEALEHDACTLTLGRRVLRGLCREHTSRVGGMNREMLRTVY